MLSQSRCYYHVSVFCGVFLFGGYGLNIWGFIRIQSTLHHIDNSVPAQLGLFATLNI